MINLSLKTDGLFDPSRLEAWTARAQEQNRNAVKRAFEEGGRDIARALNADVASHLKVARKAFPNFKGKVYADKPDRLPSLLVYSKIPWLGVHEHGGTVTSSSGRGLLIPLTAAGRRMGPKAFRRVITELMRQGNAFFKKVNGKVLVFAEQDAESGPYLGRFRKAYRQSHGLKRGVRLSRAIEIPIAVLVPSVSLRKRFDLERVMRLGLPRIVRKIEEYMAG